MFSEISLIWNFQGCIAVHLSRFSCFLPKTFVFCAEKEGVEPSRRFSRPTPFPGEPLRPLGYFSKLSQITLLYMVHPPRGMREKQSGEDGIRTHVPVKANGFQDRLVMTTSIPLRTPVQYSIQVFKSQPFSDGQFTEIFSPAECRRQAGISGKSFSVT